jgi:hypothetical protein
MLPALAEQRPPSLQLLHCQHWCVTIIFILLALRQDEFHSISDTSFVQALFEITDERVDCLVLRVYALGCWPAKRWSVLHRSRPIFR